LKGGKIEHPLHRTSEASTIGNHLKPMRPHCFMRARLDVCALFASAIAKKHAPGPGWASLRAPEVARRGSLTNETFAKLDAKQDL
jgi:hypothetical protein